MPPAIAALETRMIFRHRSATSASCASRASIIEISSMGSSSSVKCKAEFHGGHRCASYSAQQTASQAMGRASGTRFVQLRHAAFCKQCTQLIDGGEYLMVPIAALCVVGALLHLDDLAVLGKDAIGEPGNKRPHDFQNARQPRPANGENDEGPVLSLAGIDGRIAKPDVQ